MAFAKRSSFEETVWVPKGENDEGLKQEAITGYVIRSFSTRYGQAYGIRLTEDCSFARVGQLVAFIPPTAIKEVMGNINIMDRPMVRVTFGEFKEGRSGNEYQDCTLEVDEDAPRYVPPSKAKKDDDDTGVDGPPPDGDIPF